MWDDLEIQRAERELKEATEAFVGEFVTVDSNFMDELIIDLNEGLHPDLALRNVLERRNVDFDVNSCTFRSIV